MSRSMGIHAFIDIHNAQRNMGTALWTGPSNDWQLNEVHQQRITLSRVEKLKCLSIYKTVREEKSWTVV